MRGRARSASWLARRRSLFPVRWGLWVFHTARAEHRTAQQLAEECRGTGNAANDQDLLMLAHHAAGVTLSALGQHSAALKELQQAIAIHDPDRHASMAFAYGQDSGVACRCQAAFSLWFLGYPDEARRLNEEAVALAERINHPYSLAAALDYSAWVDQLRGDSAAAQKHAENAIAISMKHDFVFWLLTGMILRGWALTASNQVEEGMTQMLQALGGYEQTGAGILRPYYLALLADVYRADRKASGGASKIGGGGSGSTSKRRALVGGRALSLQGRIDAHSGIAKHAVRQRKSRRGLFRQGATRRVQSGGKVA